MSAHLRRNCAGRMAAQSGCSAGMIAQMRPQGGSRKRLFVSAQLTRRGHGAHLCRQTVAEQECLHRCAPGRVAIRPFSLYCSVCAFKARLCRQTERRSFACTVGPDWPYGDLLSHRTGLRRVPLVPLNKLAGRHMSTACLFLLAGTRE